MSKTIYTINRLSIEYYANDADNEIYESHTNLNTAKKRLKEIIKTKVYESGDWDNDEEFEEFINEHFVNDEFWRCEMAENYVEVRIIENTLND